MKNRKRELQDWEKAECYALKSAIDAFNQGKPRAEFLTQERIADALGINQGSVSSYLNGYNALNVKVAAVLSDLLQEPVEKFSPRLAAEIAKISQAVAASDRYFRGPSEEDYALIPQLTAKGSCGSGYLNEHVELTEGLVFKRDWLRRMNARPENLYVIYADGDSMEPYIFEGDVVLFDTSQTEPRHKQVYVIKRPDGGHSIKRLIQNLTGAWVIRSDNQDKTSNPDEIASVSTIHEIPILGRVIWRGGGVG